jgi:hypothetical protein
MKGHIRLAAPRCFVQLTVSVEPGDKQRLIEIAAARSVAEGRPIGVSAIARELLRDGASRRVGPDGRAA